MTAPTHWKCEGQSALGSCPAPAVYAVRVGRRERLACGRHVAWTLRYMLVPGRGATVIQLLPMPDHGTPATQPIQED